MDEFVYAASFGAFTILGVYHLGIYALRPQEKSYLYYGSMMIFLGAYTFSKWVAVTTTWLSPEAYLKIGGASSDMLAPLALGWIGALYPHDTSRRVVRMTFIGIGAAILIMLALPDPLYAQWDAVIIGPMLLLSIVAALFFILRTVYHRREGAIPFLLAMLPVIVAGIIKTIAPAGFVFIYGVIVTILIQAFLLSIRNSKAYADIENLVKNLSETNRAYYRFVPQEFLTLLNKGDITAVSLGDQIQCEMTVLFADVRNFTSISERMTPAENFAFLNLLLGAVGPLIRKNGGFIDKYQGDGIMALFPDSPRHAICAALDLQNQLTRFNEERRVQENLPPILIGVGIHTGKLILGTIGEEQRMDGTVISDVVNTTSRLESLTKRYGAKIIISENMLRSLPADNGYHLRLLGKVRPKGKNNPVELYELFDADEPAIAALKEESRADFKTALTFYQQADFITARRLFEKIGKDNPNDLAAAYYLPRCASFIERGVPAEWDGVEWMTEK